MQTMNKPIITQDFKTQTNSNVIQIDAHRIYDIDRCCIMVGKKETSPLPSAPSMIYKILLDQPGYLLSRKEIIDAYSKDREDGGPNETTLKSFILKIRDHIATEDWDPIINVNGGYMANMDYGQPQLHERVNLGRDAYFDKRNGQIVRRGYPTEQLPRRQRITLSQLSDRPNATVRYQQITEAIALDFNKVATDKSIAVYVCEIRSALKRLDLSPDIIETVTGKGFSFAPQTS